MNKNNNPRSLFIIYCFLLLSFLFQIPHVGYVTWFPDIMLLIVIFASIFIDLTTGLQIALVSGVLRGMISVYMLPMDVILFPAIGILVFTVSKMLYKHDVFVQMFITGIAILLLKTMHLLCLRAISGNSFDIAASCMNNWKVMVFTVAISPFIFKFFEGLLVNKRVR